MAKHFEARRVATSLPTALLAIGAMLTLDASLLQTAQAQGPYTFTTINVPGSTATGANAMNNMDEIVGRHYTSSGSGNFLRSSSGVYTFPYPFSEIAAVNGINNAGAIVGRPVGNSIGGTPNAAGHGFLYAGGKYTVLDYPQPYPPGCGGLNCPATSAYGLNNKDQVVGQFSDSNGMRHAFFGPVGTTTRNLIILELRKHLDGHQ
jgi:hypothetical protein